MECPPAPIYRRKPNGNYRRIAATTSKTASTKSRRVELDTKMANTEFHKKLTKRRAINRSLDYSQSLPPGQPKIHPQRRNRQEFLIILSSLLIYNSLFHPVHLHLKHHYTRALTTNGKIGESWKLLSS